MRRLCQSIVGWRGCWSKGLCEKVCGGFGVVFQAVRCLWARYVFGSWFLFLEFWNSPCSLAFASYSIVYGHGLPLPMHPYMCPATASPSLSFCCYRSNSLSPILLLIYGIATSTEDVFTIPLLYLWRILAFLRLHILTYFCRFCFAFSSCLVFGFG